MTAQVLLTKFYKDVFAAIFIWSPTARLDKGWDVVFVDAEGLPHESEGLQVLVKEKAEHC